MSRCRKPTCPKCNERKRVTDELLRQAVMLFANEGKDSTEEEMREVYRRERVILKQIKQLDAELGEILLPYENETDE